jgi:hypothetical protein
VPPLATLGATTSVSGHDFLCAMRLPNRSPCMLLRSVEKTARCGKSETLADRMRELLRFSVSAAQPHASHTP